MTDIKYKCPVCEWVGTTSEMCYDDMVYYDEYGNFEDESWTDTACPGCGYWFGNFDNERVE